MYKLLMVTGLGGVEGLVQGKKNALYNTLEEFHKHWERIDIMSPKVQFPISNFQFPNKSRNTNSKTQTLVLFGNVFIHISPWPLLFHPFFFIKKIITLHQTVHFDLMTVHEFPPFYNGIGARLVHWYTHVPYVLEIMHIPGYPRVASIKERIYRIMMSIVIRWDAKKAKAVRVINQVESPNFLVQAGVPKEKLVYIPANYIDLNVFRPSDEAKECDLIFIGRLERNKGINLILNALKILKTKYNTQSAKLLIVGDGPEKDEIKEFISEYGLPVTMFGYAKNSEEIAGLINKSKILIMSSYNEGGPRVILEAMACGVPVLATPVGIVLDIIKNKDSGTIIDWEATDIADKIDVLLNNQQIYQKYKTAGLEIVKSFERQSAIKNYAEKLYPFIK